MFAPQRFFDMYPKHQVNLPVTPGYQLLDDGPRSPPRAATSSSGL